MNKDIEFISTQILQSKAKIFDLTAAREEEETRLSSLFGALETLQMIEQRSAPQEQPTAQPSPITEAAREAGAAEKAAFRAQVQDASQLGAP